MDVPMTADYSPTEGTCSESQPDTSVDIASFQRRPCVDRPPAVGGARRADQRNPARLPNARQILPVHEQPDASQLPLGEQPDDCVWPTRFPEGVVFESLFTRVVKLQTDAPDILTFPHAHNPGGV